MSNLTSVSKPQLMDSTASVLSPGDKRPSVQVVDYVKETDNVPLGGHWAQSRVQMVLESPGGGADGLLARGHP